MNKDHAYQITRKVLDELYPEQLVIYDEWRSQRTRAAQRGESGTAHTMVEAVPDFIFSVIGAVSLPTVMSATLGVLTGTIANMITNRFGPSQPRPAWLEDDEAIQKLAKAIAAAMKAEPPES